MLTRIIRRGLAVGLCLLLAFPAGTLSATEPASDDAVRGAGTVPLGTGGTGQEAGVTTLAQGKATTGPASSGPLPAPLTKLDASSSFDAGLSAQGDALRVALREPSPNFSGALPQMGGGLLATLHPGGVSEANGPADSAVVAAEELLTVRPRLENAQQTRPVGTGAHGKMTTGERLRTFRIGSLSHEASVLIVFTIVAATVATSVAVPLTVGK